MLILGYFRVPYYSGDDNCYLRQTRTWCDNDTLRQWTETKSSQTTLALSSLL